MWLLYTGIDYRNFIQLQYVYLGFLYCSVANETSLLWFRDIWKGSQKILIFIVFQIMELLYSSLYNGQNLFNVAYIWQNVILFGYKSLSRWKWFYAPIVMVSL
jgi:hypothetical protein